MPTYKSHLRTVARACELSLSSYEAEAPGAAHVQLAAALLSDAQASEHKSEILRCMRRAECAVFNACMFLPLHDARRGSLRAEARRLARERTRWAWASRRVACAIRCGPRPYRYEDSAP